MLRKLKRSMAKAQLKKEGARKINKIFAHEWQNAYVRRVAQMMQQNGKRVVVRRKPNESTNS